LVVLHPFEKHGAASKLLGLTANTDLAMDSAIDPLLTKNRPKITAILRTRGYHSVPDLIT